jgi:hypothetical protein
MARPYREPRDNSPTRVAMSVTIPLGIRDSMVEAADQEKRTLSSMVAKALSDWLNLRGEKHGTS